ncbi:cyclin-Q isoform X2 [Phymastichus coffea]|uniref:cyclin-Q isoform X2 n=1 Tax=Phymastichus coffea TaxID=108790 RepID=UPI00273CE850|nr:cyclin-Q isoform X2 [Phymastichus coffea]XP_058798512.1 cyclin-Q isoform X2 [Phymastichus coffea]XP_058798513.1 cyclin-Q isoform X2 [Phymastichus coffea]XP_058798515.1 cyclin-Q isoform X2 [Phymastichus coffea]
MSHFNLMMEPLYSSKMKGVIDVLAMQREKRLTLQKNIKVIDYSKATDSFTVARFIFECGLKLEANVLTISTAASLFHRFMREATPQGYDPYLIAATCLYLAGKIKDNTLKIRDVMNVSYSTLHRGSPPLELGDQYWFMRDAIVQAELLIMRMLKFHVMPEHPHKYMLHYLRSLQAWFGEEEWGKYPVARTSMALLQDFHHIPAVLDYPPNLIAIACINLALQIYGVVVPLMDECDQQSWFNVFCKDLTRDKLWEIMDKVMSSYDEEPETSDR